MNKKKLIFTLSILMLFSSIDSYSQTGSPNPPPPGPPPPGLPIDGGVLILAALGAAYGMKKIKKQ